LSPILTKQFDEKTHGKDAIVGFNVMGYSPVIFLKPNIIRTFYKRSAPYRLPLRYDLPVELTQEEKEQGISFEFFINTVSNDVVQTNWGNYLFVVFQKKDKDGNKLGIEIFFWNL